MANDKLRGTLYCLTNKVNGVQYIGQTTQPLKKRLKDHFAPSKADKSYVGRAIRKYGRDSFETETIVVVSIDELNTLEQDYIDKLGTLSPKGYNLTTGGERFNHTEETKKKKISKALKGKSTWNLGVKMPEDQKEKISKAKIGKKKTEETIQKMRKARPNKKAIMDQDGNIYGSLADAGRELSLSPPSIHRVLNGQRKTTGGYSFKYLGENDVCR